MRLYERQLLANVNEMLKGRHEKQISSKDLIDFLRDRLGFTRAKSNGNTDVYYSVPTLAVSRQHWDEKVSPINWHQFATESEDDGTVEHDAQVYDLYTANDYTAYGYKLGEDDIAWDEELMGPVPKYDPAATVTDETPDLTGWQVERSSSPF